VKQLESANLALRAESVKVAAECVQRAMGRETSRNPRVAAGAAGAMTTIYVNVTNNFYQDNIIEPKIFVIYIETI
jgi:hypothetical protein